MKYKHYIFDFDGTLGDTYLWMVSVLGELSEEFHFKRIDSKDEVVLKNLGAYEILKYLHIPLWKAPALARSLRKLMSRDLESLQLFQGTKEFLLTFHAKNLSESSRLSLLSSNTKENVEGLLGSQLVECFRHFEYGSSLFGKSAKLKKIIKSSGIDSDKTIYIGDELRDIEAADKVGIASGAVTWGYNDAQVLKEANPTEFYQNFSEIH